MVEDTFLKRGSFERWWSYRFFMPRYSPREQVGGHQGLNVGASGDKLCGKMREKDPARRRRRWLPLFRRKFQCAYTARRKERGEGDRETGVRLMSFAQTVRREANVIYEDRATSQVDEVSRLENLWKRYRDVKKNGAFSTRSGASKMRIQFPRGNFAAPRTARLRSFTSRKYRNVNYRSVSEAEAELAAFKSDKVSVEGNPVRKFVQLKKYLVNEYNYTWQWGPVI